MMLGYPERLTNMLRLYELIRVRRTQGNTLRHPTRQPITCLQLSVMVQFLHESSYSGRNHALLQAAIAFFWDVASVQIYVLVKE